MTSHTRAILLMIGAMVFFTSMDAVAKGLAQRYDPVMIVWARYSSQTFWTFLILAPHVPRLMCTRFFNLQILRSALLLGATTFFFLGLPLMKLAEMTAIFEISPLFITILSVVVLGERAGLRRWLGVAAGLIGALIIIRPGTGVFSLHTLLPVLAAGCFASYAIATRFLGSEENPLTSFLYTALIGTLITSFAVPYFWTTPTLGDAAILGTFGILGGAGHFLLIRALSLAEASVLAPFSYVALISNSLWGFIFFAEIPDGFTALGALVIVAAGLYVWHRERKLTRVT